MIVGRSRAIQRALHVAERYARTTLPVLIIGPTGSGKEVVAQHIHRLSGRRGTPVDVNCGALPRDMVEGLFFGYRRGAFTGAVESSTGYLEQADRGTLLLDEVGSLPLEAQPKLLRVLETGLVQPLGERVQRRIDVRIVAAGQDDVPQAVAQGAFRRDLYQRLAGVVIELTPLRERPEDVVPLAEHFAQAQGRVLEPGVPPVLLNYEWPGNARELRLAIERAGQLVDNGTISPAALTEAIALGVPSAREERGRASAQRGPMGDRDRFIAICVANGWNAARIAATFGIARSTLFLRLKSAGLSLRRLRQSSVRWESRTLSD